MERKELICIGCPVGCNITVELEENQVIKVLGNQCKIGDEYGRKECTNPTRIVTSSLLVEEGEFPTVSIKTEKDIPKCKVMDVMKELKHSKVKAPVKIGDVILENVINTGVNIVSTRNVNKK